MQHPCKMHFESSKILESTQKNCASVHCICLPGGMIDLLHLRTLRPEYKYPLTSCGIRNTTTKWTETNKKIEISDFGVHVTFVNWQITACSLHVIHQSYCTVSCQPSPWSAHKYITDQNPELSSPQTNTAHYSFLYIEPMSTINTYCWTLNLDTVCNRSTSWPHSSPNIR